MRKFLAVTFVGLAAALLQAGDGSTKVEVKGPHVCCKQCVKVVASILDKVDGVSEVNSDIKGRTVTFTAKDNKAAKAGVKALIEGGFFGSATAGSKEIKLELPAPKKGDTADVVTVKDVHVCCGQCQSAIKNVFKDATVSFDGKGPQRTVRIEGKSLDRAEVLESLRKSGFNGAVEK
jgi:copper chaperone CopZ